MLSSSKALSECLPLENADEHINRSMDQLQVEQSHQACATLAVSSLTWAEDAIEPKTGIKFPTILDSSSACDDRSHPTTEVSLLSMHCHELLHNCACVLFCNCEGLLFLNF